MAENNGNEDLKAKMREALERKQAHLHPDDSAGSKGKAHGPEVTGGAAPKLDPVGAIWLAGGNSLVDGAAVVLDPETVPFGIHTLTCDLAWTKPQVGDPTETVTDPLLAVPRAW